MIKLVIEGSPEEIAALVKKLHERQEDPIAQKVRAERRPYESQLRAVFS